MTTRDKPDFARLLEHHPDPEDNFCELCEAASIAIVVLPHAIALGERSEIPTALMATELAAQAIEGISHAEEVDLEVILAAVQRRAKDLRSERDSESASLDQGPLPHLRH